MESTDVAVGEEGTGTVNITGGSVATVTGQAIVGDCNCANGTITVSGAGSQFNATGGGAQNVVIGWDGTGTFNALNGATATVAGEVVVGQGQGSGTLNVASGAAFTAGQITIGAGTGVGTVTVSGAGSVLTSNGATEIGAGGTANNSVNVLDGATGNLGGISVGFFGGTGTLKVDASSQVNGTSYGQDAASTLNVGISPTGNGKVAITGADINLDGSLVVAAKTTQAKKYDIMTTDNGVVGTFSSVSVVGNANNLQVAYNVPCGGLQVRRAVGGHFLARQRAAAGHLRQCRQRGRRARQGDQQRPHHPRRLLRRVRAQRRESGQRAVAIVRRAGGRRDAIQYPDDELVPIAAAQSVRWRTRWQPRRVGSGRASAADEKRPAGGAAAYAAVTPKDTPDIPFAPSWGVWGAAYGG